MNLDESGEAGRVGEEELIRQQHGERFVADQMAGAEDGVAESEGLLLAREDSRTGREQRALNLRARCIVAAHGEMSGEFLVVGKMPLERRLVSAGDEDELLDPRGSRLVDRILDKRPVEHGQHLLGHRLARRQEARAHAGDREYRLPHGFRHSRGLALLTDGHDGGGVPRRLQRGKRDSEDEEARAASRACDESRSARPRAAPNGA